jgi:outer membrane protein
MSIIKKISLFASILLLSTAVQAQVKLGHINSSELVGMMPETKVADDSLKRYTEDLNGQLQMMLTELQNKYQEFQSKQSSMSEAVREYRAKEIQDLQTNIDNFQQRAQQDIAKKKEDVYGPIFKKAEEAIKEIAKEGKYSYIFDTSVGAILYSNDSENIMDAVKKKLNITAETPKRETPKR